jgi:hypothetical protein
MECICSICAFDRLYDACMISIWGFTPVFPAVSPTLPGENQGEWLNMGKHGNASEYWGSFTCWGKSSENVLGKMVNSSEVAVTSSSEILFTDSVDSVCQWDNQGSREPHSAIHTGMYE